MSQVHPCARTTPRTRSEISTSLASVTTLACLYNITVATARKWKGRKNVQYRFNRRFDLGTIFKRPVRAAAITTPCPEAAIRAA